MSASVIFPFIVYIQWSLSKDCITTGDLSYDILGTNCLSQMNINYITIEKLSIMTIVFLKLNGFNMNCNWCLNVEFIRPTLGYEDVS